MRRFTVAIVLVTVVALVIGGIWVALFNPLQATSNSGLPTIFTYHIVKTYAHDPTAFTEGLVFNDGVLYESTGEYGYSSLRKVNLENGNVDRKSVV
jgi:glutamine cyclotransferase